MTLKIQQKQDLVHYVSSQNACQPNATYGELTRNLWHYMLGAKIAQPFYLEKPEDYNIDNQLTQIVIDGELVNMYYEAEKTILFNFFSSLLIKSRAGNAVQEINSASESSRSRFDKILNK